MSLFTYEEQGDKRYLVYEKREEDQMDMLTLEMMSNNRIDGVIPSDHIQIDDKFYMKYNITGLQNLREHLQGAVNRQKTLELLESIADAAMASEDYMLDLSSYVLDMDYMYVDAAAGKISMIVLPIRREEMTLDIFLKELLIGIRYDQTEDCSYVAALINLFGGSGSFSVYTFKEQIARFKKEDLLMPQGKAPNQSPQAQPSYAQFSQAQPSYAQFSQAQPPQVQFPQAQSPQVRTLLPQAGAGLKLSEKDRAEIVRDLKREHNLEILFGDEDDLAKKEKKSFLKDIFKKEKSEKPEQKEKKDKKDKKEKKEKKGFWGKKGAADKELDMGTDLNGIAIPGQRAEPALNGIAIPAQRVEMPRQNMDEQDFGQTIELSDEEDTIIPGVEYASARREFLLYRRRTNEVFQIHEEITRVGRSPSLSEIHISGNRSVGRVHALLHIHKGEVFIQDNHSKNKTYVDGIPLDPGQSPCKLENGSRIRLGDEELEFRVQD